MVLGVHAPPNQENLGQFEKAGVHAPRIHKLGKLNQNKNENKNKILNTNENKNKMKGKRIRKSKSN